MLHASTYHNHPSSTFAAQSPVTIDHPRLHSFALSPALTPVPDSTTNCLRARQKSRPANLKFGPPPTAISSALPPAVQIPATCSRNGFCCENWKIALVRFVYPLSLWFFCILVRAIRPWPVTPRATRPFHGDTLVTPIIRRFSVRPCWIPFHNGRSGTEWPSFKSLLWRIISVGCWKSNSYRKIHTRILKCFNSIFIQVWLSNV